MSARVRDTLLLAALFVAALAPRLLCAFEYGREHPNARYPVIDERSYDAWAREIAAGDWLGDEVFFQEPLYPYFLAVVYRLTGGSLELARIVQAVLGALTCVLLALLTARLFGRLAGGLAGSGLALALTGIVFPSYLLKPNLLLPVLVLLAGLLVRELPRRETRTASWLALGGLAGLGALLRGNVLILLPFLAAWIAFEAPARRLARAALFSAGAALVLAPVCLRNLAVGGVPALTTSGAGTNLYGGNNADNPHGIATEFDWVRGVPEHEADDWRREAERRLGRDLDAGEVSRYWMGEVWSSVERDPWLHAEILWNKLRVTLSSYEVPDNHDLRWDARFVGLLRLPWPGFGVLGVLCLAGALLAPFTRGAADARRFALLFAAYLATIVLTVTSMRIRLALLPLGLPLAGWFAVECGRRVRAGNRRDLLAPAACLTVAALFVHVPVFDAATLAERLANRDYNLAVQLLDEEREFERVVELSRDLSTRYPRSSRVRILASEVEFRGALLDLRSEETRGRGEARVQAALDLLRPLASDPDVPAREKHRLRRLSGWIQLRIGNGAAAENHFRRALEFDDEDPQTWLGLVQALLAAAERLPAGDPARAAKLAELRTLLRERLEPGSDAALDLARRADALGAR